MGEDNHFVHYESDYKKQLEGRYWNANGVGICVMASITKGVDWAAYIGADNGWRERDCMAWTLEKGVKLREQDARYFFSDFELPYRH